MEWVRPNERPAVDAWRHPLDSTQGIFPVSPNESSESARLSEESARLSEDSDSQDSKFEFAAKRTTVTLANKYLLRGTTTATLLTGAGRRLRGTSGGIGLAKTDAEDEFLQSFEVEEVDYFLSHSWHASWVLKYFTLLFYFNLTPAMFFSLVVGTAVCWARHAGHCRSWSIGIVGSVPRYCLISGVVTFMTVLFSWHHFVNVLPRPYGGKSMFLDKVCIHQTDVNKKEQGIKSIGAILKNSKELLVTWDSTYFSRLWCTYEMSAFMYAKGSGCSVIIIPVDSGGLVGVLVFGEIGTEIVFSFLTTVDDYSIHHQDMFYVLVWFITCMVVQVMLRRYLLAVKELATQLQRFSVKKSECFCCKANHVNPIDGSRLPCDREVVYGSIIHWQGTKDKERGLQKFDQMVHGTFGEYVGRSLGAAAAIPFRYCLAVGVISVLMGFDRRLAADADVVEIVINSLNWMMIQPLAIGLLINNVSRAPYEGKPWCMRQLIHVMLAAVNSGVFLGMLVLKNELFAIEDTAISVTLSIALILFQACWIWLLFFHRSKSMIAEKRECDRLRDSLSMPDELHRNELARKLRANGDTKANQKDARKACETELMNMSAAGNTL